MTVQAGRVTSGTVQKKAVKIPMILKSGKIWMGQN